MTEYVDYRVADDIATLTMDDGKANAFGPDMIAALSAGLDRAATEARVVVVAGRPGVMCGGFDLKIIRGGDQAALNAMRAAGAEALMKFYVHPQPVIFACTGHAIAAGALLVLTGDIRIGMDGDFKIGLNETGISLSLPTFGLELARDRLDPRMVTRATLGAELFAPADAAAVGYLDRVVAADGFSAAVDGVAQDMLKLGPEAFAVTKARLRQPTVDRIRATFAAELA